MEGLIKHVRPEDGGREALKYLFAELRDLGVEERGLVRDFIVAGGGVSALFKFLGIPPSVAVVGLVGVAVYYAWKVVWLGRRRDEIESLIRGLADNNSGTMRPTSAVVKADLFFIAFWTLILVIALFL